MAREQLPLRPIQVDYKCDQCGKGYMRSQGLANLTSPMSFPHKCNECGHKQTFYEKHPTMRYAKEGELLDLDNYIENKQY